MHKILYRSGPFSWNIRFLFQFSGNFYISELTNAGYTVLGIDLISFDGDKRRIEYNFQVENQSNKYKLHISERNVSGIGKWFALFQLVVCCMVKMLQRDVELKTICLLMWCLPINFYEYTYDINRHSCCMRWITFFLIYEIR